MKMYYKKMLLNRSHVDSTYFKGKLHHKSVILVSNWSVGSKGGSEKFVSCSLSEDGSSTPSRVKTSIETSQILQHISLLGH